MLRSGVSQKNSWGPALSLHVSHRAAPCRTNVGSLSSPGHQLLRFVLADSLGGATKAEHASNHRMHVSPGCSTPSSNCRVAAAERHGGACSKMPAKGASASEKRGRGGGGMTACGYSPPPPLRAGRPGPWVPRYPNYSTHSRSAAVLIETRTMSGIFGGKVRYAPPPSLHDCSAPTQGRRCRGHPAALGRPALLW